MFPNKYYKFDRNSGMTHQQREFVVDLIQVLGTTEEIDPDTCVTIVTHVDTCYAFAFYVMDGIVVHHLGGFEFFTEDINEVVKNPKKFFLLSNIENKINSISSQVSLLQSRIDRLNECQKELKNLFYDLKNM